MKSSDRAIVIGLAIVGMLAAFWFLVLSPKRGEVSTLDTEITEVRAAVDEQRQLAADAEQAREDYDKNYHRLVVLGKAVPAGDDTASLFVQLDQVAAQANVGFDAITLNENTGITAPPPVATETTAESGSEEEGSEEGDSATPAPGVPAAATEADAAGLPIGAVVGAAGLPTMPYALTLRGDFFQFADFLAGVDRLVGSEQARPAADGRLVTIDGFSLAVDRDKDFPHLTADLAVTTYVTPADQGLTAGATPTAPPATPATPTPASTPTPAPTP